MNGGFPLQMPLSTTSAKDIEMWLAAQVAAITGLSTDQVDVTQPFAEYGLDSLKAVTLVADLEYWLGLDLPATLFWDFPTIEAVAKVLTSS